MDTRLADVLSRICTLRLACCSAFVWWCGASVPS